MTKFRKWLMIFRAEAKSLNESASLVILKLMK